MYTCTPMHLYVHVNIMSPFKSDTKFLLPYCGNFCNARITHYASITQPITQTELTTPHVAINLTNTEV